MKAAKHWKWTPEACDLMHSYWGIMSSRAVARKISDVTGHHFTAAACCQKAHIMGLTVELAQPYVSVAVAARELGISMHAVMYRHERMGFKYVGQGPLTLLTDEAWAALQAFYTRPMEATVGVTEAANRLGYTTVGVTEAANRLGYTTVSVAVPIETLVRSLQEAMAVTWPAAQRVCQDLAAVAMFAWDRARGPLASTGRGRA